MALKDLSLEERRKHKREYMRRYNKTDKGKAYLRKKRQEWRASHPKEPHSPYPSRATSYYRLVIIDFLVKRDGLNCGICHQSLEASRVHINHKHPAALGGPDIMENLDLTHPECNIGQAAAIRNQKYGYGK